MIQHFSSTIFTFFDFARQLFPPRVRHQTSATKLRYLRSSAFHRQPKNVSHMCFACGNMILWFYAQKHSKTCCQGMHIMEYRILCIWIVQYSHPKIRVFRIFRFEKNVLNKRENCKVGKKVVSFSSAVAINFAVALFALQSMKHWTSSRHRRYGFL